MFYLRFVKCSTVWQVFMFKTTINFHGLGTSLSDLVAGGNLPAGTGGKAFLMDYFVQSSLHSSEKF